MASQEHSLRKLNLYITVSNLYSHFDVPEVPGSEFSCIKSSPTPVLFALGFVASEEACALATDFFVASSPSFQMLKGAFGRARFCSWEPHQSLKQV